MIVQLYNFAKKQNSTARPSGTGDQYDCRLKDQTSITNPVILLDLNDKVNFTKYTYAYIPEFSRYYFVSDMVADGLCWSVYLTCDVLATYKTEIGNSSMYVMRSAAAFNGNIVDTFYPVKITHTDVQAVEANPMNMDSSTGLVDVNTGCFILGIVGTASGDYNYGSIRYYAMGRTSFNSIINSLLNDVIASGNSYGFTDDDMSFALQKSIIDPLSFIKSCMWVPVSAGQLGSQWHTTMKVFDWTIRGVYVKELELNPPQTHDVDELSLTRHPYAATRGRYMNVEPYTRIQLIYPPFGVFDIDTASAEDQTALSCETFIDLITGSAILKVRGKESGKMFVNASSQVGVDIQLSQITKDYVGSIMQGVQAGVSAVGFDFGGAATAAVGSVISAYKPIVSNVGGNGGYSDLNGKIVLHQEYFEPVPDDNTNAGRPLCEIRQLSTLPGYQLIMDGDVLISGTAGEQAAIKSFLEGGYYYE